MCGHLRGTLDGTGSQQTVFNPCWYACYMIKVEAHIRGKTKPFDTQKVNKVNHCNIFNKNWSQKLGLPILLDEKTSQWSILSSNQQSNRAC